MKTILIPSLLAIAWLALPALSPAQDGPWDANPPDEFDNLPKLIRVQVEFIEVPHETFTKLMAAPRVSTNDTNLRKKLAELIEKKQANVVETMACIARSGQKATCESIMEFIYPTEYEPADLPDEIHTSKDGEKSEVGNKNHAIGPTPTAYETRNLGSTLEIEPTIGDDSRIIDLRLAPEIVYHVGNVTWAEWKDARGDASIRMPSFHTLRFNTCLTLATGQPTLAAALSPKNEDGFPDFSRKVMVFARADTLSVGLPTESPAPAKSTTRTAPDPIRLDAVPGMPLPADTTVVWTAAFPAVWQQAASKLGLKSIELNPPTSLSKQLQKWTIDPDAVLPKNRMLIAGPATDKFAATANRQLESLLGNDFPPLSVRGTVPGGFILACAVNESLAFKHRFTRARIARLPFRTGSGRVVPVHYFGVPAGSGESYVPFIDILASDMERNAYTLSLQTNDPDQFVILSTGWASNTLAEAIETVRSQKSEELAETFHPEDTLRIPVLHLNTSANYTNDLSGMISVPDAPVPWLIANARQYARLDMNETGVEVKIRAEMEMAPLGPSPNKPKPRHYRFDRPFFLFIWRNDADFPWLAARIDGNGALTQ